jgi:hypothetical protein
VAAPANRLTCVPASLVRARSFAATRGPWKAYIEGRDHESGSSFIMTGERANRGEDIELSGATVADYDFIATPGRTFRGCWTRSLDYDTSSASDSGQHNLLLQRTPTKPVQVRLEEGHQRLARPTPQAHGQGAAS